MAALEDIKKLTEWPKRREDVTVDLMLRVIGCDTQGCWLDKWEAMDAGEKLGSPLYHARTHNIISGVGLMAAIRAFRDADPVKAEAFVRDYWEMCDAGDEFGPTLWEYTEQAGLNPELIKQARTDNAVAGT